MDVGLLWRIILEKFLYLVRLFVLNRAWVLIGTGRWRINGDMRSCNMFITGILGLYHLIYTNNFVAVMDVVFHIGKRLSFGRE